MMSRRDSRDVTAPGEEGGPSAGGLRCRGGGGGGGELVRARGLEGEEEAGLGGGLPGVEVVGDEGCGVSDIALYRGCGRAGPSGVSLVCGNGECYLDI